METQNSEGRKGPLEVFLSNLPLKGPEYVVQDSIHMNF